MKVFSDFLHDNIHVYMYILSCKMRGAVVNLYRERSGRRVMFVLRSLKQILPVHTLGFWDGKIVIEKII